MVRNKIKSPYLALTTGSLLFDETNAMLPLLLSADRKELVRDEIVHNQRLRINAETSRKKVVSEISRRFDTMSASFWADYQAMTPADQKVALFFVILKTYRVFFDFHVNLTMLRWRSVQKQVTREDVLMELNEIAVRDEFVNSWTTLTCSKVASTYLTILRHIGMLDDNDTLHAIFCSNFNYYITIGEQWFLEACLLQPYEIDKIRQII